MSKNKEEKINYREIELNSENCEYLVCEEKGTIDIKEYAGSEFW